MTKIIFIILICIIGIIAYDTFRMYFLFRKTLDLEKNFEAFSREIPNETLPKLEEPIRILVVGDSTAVGTGSETSESSTAGRLGAKYPDAEIVNLAQNGLRISELSPILESIDSNEHFDIVLIQIGANDIIRFTSTKKIEGGIRKVLEKTKSLGEKVIVLHSGDIGESRFFPWYVRPLLTKKSLKTREIYIKQANIYGASYVDLISASSSKLFLEDYNKYYAKDLLHLTGDGYGLWFDEINKQI